MASPRSKADPRAFASRITFTSLNTDILLAVMTYIRNDNDLVALMSISRGLFALGLPELLGRRYSLNDNSIGPFYDFLISTAPRSFGALRSLTFHKLPLTRAPLVAEILQRASGLKELDMRIDLADIVCDAIISLTTLQKLWIFSDCSLETGQKLAHIQSPLTTLLVMAFSFDIGDPVPVSRFSRLCPSLEYMNIENAELLPAEPQLCYPRVTHLELHSCSTPSLPVLMAAFPNLEHLEINCGAPEDLIRVSHEIRQENREWKAQPDQWKALQFVIVDRACFDALALRGNVPYLDISSHISFPDGEETSRIQDAFSRLDIQHLRLRVGGELTHLADVFSASLYKLTRLDLEVIFKPIDPDTPQQRLNTVFGALTCLTHLRELDLALYHLFTQRRVDGHAAVKKFLKRLDMAALARRVMEASPAVISIGLRVRGGSSERTSDWMVSGEGEDRQSTEVENGLHQLGPDPDSEPEELS